MTAPPEDVRRLEFYRANPIEFLIDVLGVKRELVWPAMEEMAESVRDHQRTAAKGSHNSSKTFTVAALAWWWLLCWPDSKLYATSTKKEQVVDVFWAQMVDLYNAAPVPLGGTLLATEWKDDLGVTRAVGRVVKKDTGAGGATGMQGFKSQRLMVVFEEATGIDRAVWESATGIVTFPENRWVAIGNPTNPNCGFRDCFRPLSGWNCVTFDALANPNLEGAEIDVANRKVIGGQVVHPHLATPEWVQNTGLRIYGYGSPSWESRVRSEFPSAAINTLISIADLNMARDRDPKPPSSERSSFIGCDVAAQGDDYSVIAVVTDDDLAHLEWFHEPDTTRTGDRLIQVAQDFGLTPARADRISVDRGGIGKGTYDHVCRRGWQVNGEDFGSSAHHDTLYYLRRSELWVGVRDWLRTDGSLKNARPDWLRMLEADLCGCEVDPFHAYKGHTVLRLEKKLDMKKRLGHSPDWGDALALALAHRTRRKRLFRPSPKQDAAPSHDFRDALYAADKKPAERRSFFDD